MTEQDKPEGGQPEPSDDELAWEETSEANVQAEATAAQAKRDSFIPLPHGFRQRKGRESSSSGLEWSGKAPAGDGVTSLRSPTRPPPAPAREQPLTAPAVLQKAVAAKPVEAARPIEAPKPASAPKPAASLSTPPRAATKAVEKVKALETRTIHPVTSSATRSEATPTGAPRSVLAPLGPETAHQPQLIYSQAGNPTAEMPIVYRERAYFVDSVLGDDELKDSLQKELASLQEELRGWEQVKYVQLALFDHKFQRQPNGPPLATLSWKDWQSEPEIWVRGVRHSGPLTTETSAPKTDWDLSLDAYGPSTERGGIARVPEARVQEVPAEDTRAHEAHPTEPRPKGPLLQDDAGLAQQVLPAAVQRPRPSAPPRPKIERPSEPIELSVADAPFSDEPGADDELFADAPLADTAAAPPVAERPVRLSAKPPIAPSAHRRGHSPLEPELIEAEPESLDGDALSEVARYEPPIGFLAPSAADGVDWGDRNPMPLVRRRHSLTAPSNDALDDPEAFEEREPESIEAASVEEPASIDEPEPSPLPSSGLDEEPIPLVSIKPSGPLPNFPERADGVAGRHQSNDELLGSLFERMHELLFASSISDGAEFVLSVLAETIPCEGVIIHVFNRDDRSFVVVRAKGPNSERILLSRTPETDPRLAAVLRRENALVSDGEPANSARRRAEIGGASLWQRLGITVEQSLSGPARHERGYLGLIELANPRGGGAFYPSEINALDYICEQFADFVAERPIRFD